LAWLFDWLKGPPAPFLKEKKILKRGGAQKFCDGHREDGKMRVGGGEGFFPGRKRKWRSLEGTSNWLPVGPSRREGMGVKKLRRWIAKKWSPGKVKSVVLVNRDKGKKRR